MECYARFVRHFGMMKIVTYVAVQKEYDTFIDKRMWEDHVQPNIKEISIQYLRLKLFTNY